MIVTLTRRPPDSTRGSAAFAARPEENRNARHSAQGAIKASPAQTYEALATVDGLSTWWTSDTRGGSKPGGVIHFQFGERGYFDMKVIELTPTTRVRWEVIEPEAWIGTQIGFDLSQEDDYTAVLFKHQDWKEPSVFMHHCTTKWAMFLMSLKTVLETGTGAPFPHDVRISNKGD